MTIKVTKKTNNLEQLIDKIKAAHEKKVESGYFKEQGNHSSGYSYVALMNLHEFGLGNFPSRPVITITKHEISTSPDFKISIQNKLARYFNGNIDADYLLDEVGEGITDIAKSIFGKSPPLAENSPEFWGYKGFNAPLIDTGELRENWAWRNSINKSIKTS